MSKFKGPQGFGEWMNIWMNVAMGLIITLAINVAVCMQLGMNIITPEAVIASWVSSFVIGYTVGNLGDPMGWALKLAASVKNQRFDLVLNAIREQRTFLVANRPGIHTCRLDLEIKEKRSQGRIP